MRCCECQSVIIGKHYRRVTRPLVAVCSDHACQIEHAKERVTGKDLTEFISDRLSALSRDILLEIALDYVADSEQEFCEWFFSDGGPYVEQYAYEDDEDEDARSWSSYDRERD